MHRTQKTRRIAALLSLIFALLYSVAQIMTLLKWLPAPYDLIAMFIPSLLLAPCFMVTMASLHYSHANESKIFGMVGMSFSILYCALVSIVYFTQLGTIIPMQLRGEVVDKIFLFQGTGIMVAIDALGYTFMSMGTFFMARSFTQQPGLYRSMFIHGLLAAVILASFFFPFLMAVGSLWMITLPWAMIEVMRSCNGHQMPATSRSTRIRKKLEPVQGN